MLNTFFSTISKSPLADLISVACLCSSSDLSRAPYCFFSSGFVFHLFCLDARWELACWSESIVRTSSSSLAPSKRHNASPVARGSTFFFPVLFKFELQTRMRLKKTGGRTEGALPENVSLRMAGSISGRKGCYNGRICIVRRREWRKKGEASPIATLTSYKRYY